MIVLASLLLLRLAAPMLSAATGRPAGFGVFSLDFSQPAAASVRDHDRRRPHETGGDREARLASVIYGMQPRKGRAYADRVASLVMADAHRERLRPEVVAATATVESRFDMRSGPCIGIMQMNPRTVREHYRHSDLSARSLGGNLRLGTAELARHYDEAERSGRRSERARLAVMWGRYNGAGPRSGYVRRCMAAYRAILRDEG